MTDDVLLQGGDNFAREFKQLRRSFRFNEYKSISDVNPPRNFVERVSAVLRYAVACCALLWCAVLFCGMLRLCHAVLRRAVLCVQCCAMLLEGMLRTCAVLRYAMLCHAVLFCVMLRCAVPCFGAAC